MKKLSLRKELIDLLTNRLSSEDLDNLAFELSLDGLTTPNINARDGLVELLKIAEKNGKAAELLDRIKITRPDINWTEIYLNHNHKSLTDMSDPRQIIQLLDENTLQLVKFEQQLIELEDSLSTAEIDSLVRGDKYKNLLPIRVVVDNNSRDILTLRITVLAGAVFILLLTVIAVLVILLLLG